jgi:hypothetical protein
MGAMYEVFEHLTCELKKIRFEWLFVTCGCCVAHCRYRACRLDQECTLLGLDPIHFPVQMWLTFSACASQI